ncbi:N-acetyltransferase [Siculibacillus lacustris]|uniref:N-acetyltransferase n=1 Tax=Siculibacillus lacustris TaxID=1549641 RepID=A0A4Q9VGV7_9HYPH|nr:N-acetyltransferase [Siculibacillus lacustris]TBW34290.1 N-acetyltransferase [Siculibacillus lacustris]
MTIPATIEIRPERPSDHATIYDLVKTAFLTAKVSNGKEQDFVDELRAAPHRYLPDLALVAVEDATIVGHVMLTRMPIATATGDRETLLVAPLAVVLDRRSRRIGSQLLRAALDRGRAAGFESVVLVGDPAYYGRFGFRPSTDFGVVNTNGIPAEYVMALELQPGALAGIDGRIGF